MGLGISNSRSSPAKGVATPLALPVLAALSNSCPRTNMVSRETSRWPSRSTRSFLASSSCTWRASGLDCCGPASKSIISSCEQLGLPVVASSRPRNETRPASNSWVAEEIPANGAMTCCHAPFSDSFGISPWRTKICQRPTLPCKVPMALPRRS